MYLAVIAPLLASWALLTLIAAVALLAGLAIPRSRAYLADLAARSDRPMLATAWLVALTATTGSLYFSEVVGFVPCLLCWYQRIAMYPLAIVLGVAALASDRGVWRYALPLAAVGGVISSYHVLIQLRPTLDLLTCSLAVPCSARYLAVFGFVSIPFMAGAGFLGIAALMLLTRAGGQASEKPMA